MTTVYERNEVMKLLGKQYLPEKETLHKLFEIANIYKEECGYETYIITPMLDAFNLGYIIGKQEERTRNKSRKGTNGTNKDR